MKEKFLPIGTVVLLKEGTKKVMITSFMIFTSGENGEEKKMFDYGACPFPEGIIDSSYAVGFNHDQIDQIVHLGLVDEDEVHFNTLLLQSQDEIHKKFEEEFNVGE